MAGSDHQRVPPGGFTPPVSPPGLPKRPFRFEPPADRQMPKPPAGLHPKPYRHHQRHKR